MFAHEYTKYWDDIMEANHSDGAAYSQMTETLENFLVEQKQKGNIKDFRYDFSKASDSPGWTVYTFSLAVILPNDKLYLDTELFDVI